MEKRSLIILTLIGAAAMSSAQVHLGMSDRLMLNGFDRPASVVASPASRADAGDVELIVRYDGEATLEAIRAAGGDIVSLVGFRTAIVRVSPDKASAVAAARGITGARVSRKVAPVNMLARAASDVDRIHAGDGLDQPYDGSGVVVGLYDLGLDPNHINFRGPDGLPRVTQLWEYVGQNIGNDYYDSPDRVRRFTTDYGDSHGTHVLGILGGSFVDPADPTHDYRGMAPGAELVVTCGGGGYNAQILDGLEKIGKYAAAQGKPCVVNLSFGDNLGPHDGTDEFTEAINDIVDKYGMILCMAGGNERDNAIAIIKECTADDPEVRTLLLPAPDTGMDETFQTFGTIYVYGQDDTPFDVSLEVIGRSNPDEAQYTLELPEGSARYLTQGNIINTYIEVDDHTELVGADTPFQTIYTSSFVGGSRGIDPYNQRYCAMINSYLQGRTSSNVARNFVALRVKAKPGKKVFVYCDGLYMNFGSKNLPGFDVPDGNGTNSNMGSGKSTIAVGSYVTANVAGSPYTFGKVGDLSWFSSYGETPDGRTMPFISAPGQVIISSRNSHLGTGESASYYYPIHYSYKEKGAQNAYNWTSCAGTSQASPHVAGVVALWLSANPDLTADDVRAIMTATAKEPTSSDIGWGVGRLDAYAGLKAALSGEFNAVADVTAPTGDVIVRRSGSAVEAFVPGADRVSLTLFDLAGNAVLAVNADGDTAVLCADAAPRGIYVARVESPRGVKAVKIAL